MGYSSRLSHKTTKRFNNFKNHADRIIDSNKTPHYMEMDGVNEYIDVPDIVSVINGQTVGTWNTWMNSSVATASGVKVLISADNTGNTEDIFLFFISGKVRAIGRTGDVVQWDVITDNVVLSDNTWHMISLAQDGIEPKIFINGVESASTFTISIDKTLWLNDISFNQFWLGRRDIGGYANTSLDEASVWDKGLTSGEITQIYNKGRFEVDYSDLSFFSNCVSHWGMGEDDTATWDGANWTIEDKVGSNDGVTVNMEYEDRKPTEIFSTFGSLGLAFGKWFGGVLAPGGFIYGIPYGATDILKIDTSNDTVSTFGDLSAIGGGNKWDGGVLAPNGFIYGIPRNATSVLKIDTSKDTATTFGNIAGSLKWTSGILAPNGCIYGIPNSATSVLKIDPTTDTITTFGSYTAGGSGFKWQGGVLAPNGIIYCVPFRANKILRIDTNNDTVSEFGSYPVGGEKWLGGAISKDGKVYFAPQNRTDFLKIDPLNDSITSFGSLPGTGVYVYGGMYYMPNNRFYGIPSELAYGFKLNPENDTAITIGTIGGSPIYAWFSGLSSPNGAIYGIPFDGSSVLKIENEGVINGFDEDFLMSGYYNKI